MIKRKKNEDNRKGCRLSKKRSLESHNPIKNRSIPPPHLREKKAMECLKKNLFVKYKIAKLCWGQNSCKVLTKYSLKYKQFYWLFIFYNAGHVKLRLSFERRGIRH